MSLSTLGEKFEFLIIPLKVSNFNPRVLAPVWVSVWLCGRPGVRAYGCVGDWVFFSVVTLSPFSVSIAKCFDAQLDPSSSSLLEHLPPFLAECPFLVRGTNN